MPRGAGGKNPIATAPRRTSALQAGLVSFFATVVVPWRQFSQAATAHSFNGRALSAKAPRLLMLTQYEEPSKEQAMALPILIVSEMPNEVEDLRLFLQSNGVTNAVIAVESGAEAMKYLIGECEFGDRK